MAYAIFSSICLIALLALGNSRIIVQDSLDNITISNPSGDNVSGDLIGFKDYKYVRPAPRSNTLPQFKDNTTIEGPLCWLEEITDFNTTCGDKNTTTDNWVSKFASKAPPNPRSLPRRSSSSATKTRRWRASSTRSTRSTPT